MSSRYSQNEQIALFWAPKLPAIISAICSVVVVSHLIGDGRLFKVYGRLWFAVSVGNILICVMAILSSVPAPQGTYYGSFGTEQTCSAAGAFFHFVFVNCMGYNASLGIYYYISVHTKWNDAYVRRNIEPWFHLVSWAYPTVGVAFGLRFKMYAAHDMFMYCWSAPSPFGCRYNDDIPCTSGNRLRPLFVFLSGLVECNMLTGMKLMGVFSLCFAVLKQQQVMRSKYHAQAINTIARETTIQAALFLGACLVPYTFSILFRLFDLFWVNAPNPSTQAFFIFSIVTQTLFPLQGVLNMFTYFRPKVAQRRRDCPTESFRDSMRNVWLPAKIAALQAKQSFQTKAANVANMQKLDVNSGGDVVCSTTRSTFVVGNTTVAPDASERTHCGSSDEDPERDMQKDGVITDQGNGLWEANSDVLAIDVNDVRGDIGCIPGEDLAGDCDPALVNTRSSRSVKQQLPRDSLHDRNRPAGNKSMRFARTTWVGVQGVESHPRQQQAPGLNKN